MESVAEAMEFFRYGNAGKMVLVVALVSVLVPFNAEAMPAPRKYKYFHL